MTVFDAYALYYDFLYKDKNYNLEAEYINNLIKKYLYINNKILGNKIINNKILELGCGTGIHACLLAQMGYNICGIDISQNMIQQAEERKKSCEANILENLSFIVSDLKDFKINQKFDIVLSLFHVISYQITNQDLKSAFKTAQVNLNKNGLFIFDCWYGPAVLAQKPQVRIKNFKNNNFSLTRIAQPMLFDNDNIVDVNYKIFIKNLKTEKTEEIEETHKMRYLFKPEIELFLSEYGFTIVRAEEWLTGKDPSADTWGVCFICKKD